MSHIVLGKAGQQHNVNLDLDVLLRTRLLVTADSGGGKTVLLKRLCEQIFGKVPIIIIDPEGEFSPLREKFGFVLVGPGGETPADPRSAALVAQTLLKLRASAVCDLYEMKPSARHEWVKNFCDALIDAPKALWHPTIVIVDEASIFCPESKAGESQATEAVKALGTRGRKRGICLVAATQRLAELNKGVSGMCLNRLVGGTFEDVNQKRALDVLSVNSEDKAEFLHQLKLLEPGYFFALGRAICTERTLIKVGPIETAHGDQALKYANEPPPAPEQIAKLLPKLADLPKAAEEKAKTEAELRGEIRSLKSQLRSAPNVAKEVAVADPKAIERAVRSHHQAWLSVYKEARNNASGLLRKLNSVQVYVGAPLSPLIWPGPPQISGAEIPTKGHAESPRTIPPPIITPTHPLPINTSNGNGDHELTGPMRKILKALVELNAIGKDSPPKEMCAAWAGYSARGGAFGNPIGALNSLGLARYPSPGFVSITEEGMAAIGTQSAPDPLEVRRRIESICTGPERKILTALLEIGEAEISKEELAQRSGYSPVGGAFGNPIGALRTKGLLDYPRPGYVRAAEWLFAA